MNGEKNREMVCVESPGYILDTCHEYVCCWVRMCKCNIMLTCGVAVRWISRRKRRISITMLIPSGGALRCKALGLMVRVGCGCGERGRRVVDAGVELLLFALQRVLDGCSRVEIFSHSAVACRISGPAQEAIDMDLQFLSFAEFSSQSRAVCRIQYLVELPDNASRDWLFYACAIRRKPT